MVHTVKLFPWSHHTRSILRLGQGTHPNRQAVRVMARHGYKSKGPNPIAPLGRRLESWPDTLAAGQAVRVLVWLGLESWSDMYILFPWSHHTWSILRLG